MPNKLSKPCAHAGCKILTTGKYCAEHKPVIKENRESAGKRGYDGKWRKYTKSFLAKHPFCISCGGLANTVDHIIPHKGDKGLFWDTENHQAMCARCHSRKTAKEDRKFGKKQER